MSPQKPSPPASPFLIWWRKKREELRQAHPQKKYEDLLQEGKKCWAKLSPQVKGMYAKKSREDKDRYLKEKKQYDKAMSDLAEKAAAKQMAEAVKKQEEAAVKKQEEAAKKASPKRKPSPLSPPPKEKRRNRRAPVGPCDPPGF